MKTPVKSVELPSGIRLSYTEQGDADGVPMLLLHGVTDSWHSFEPVLPYLPSSIHAFAFSQRGHGDVQESTLAQPVPEAFLNTVVQESLKGAGSGLAGGI